MQQTGEPMDVEHLLTPVYEEVMWLARRRKQVSAALARSWYTHVTSVTLRKHFRKFSGKVSRKALVPNAEIRLEHFNRLQTRLTNLVIKHRDGAINDPNEFIREVIECEQVHIVERMENYEAMRAKGDYSKTGIVLEDWNKIQPEIRWLLWSKALNGRVSNANEFKPIQQTRIPSL